MEVDGIRRDVHSQRTPGGVDGFVGKAVVDIEILVQVLTFVWKSKMASAKSRRDGTAEKGVTTIGVCLTIILEVCRLVLN